MKHSLHTVLTLLFVCASAWGENVPLAESTNK